MNGLTIREISEKLSISMDAAKKRLQTAGIKPEGYAGPTAIYPAACLEAIRNTPGPGRPAKAKE